MRHDAPGRRGRCRKFYRGGVRHLQCSPQMESGAWAPLCWEGDIATQSSTCQWQEWTCNAVWERPQCRRL
eukprot:2719266-Amphidinium_carterae.1